MPWGLPEFLQFSWKIQTQQDLVSYLLVLKADANYDGLAKKFKKIGRRLRVDLVWKTRVSDASSINSEKLKSGRHKHAEIVCDDKNSGTCVRLEGSICVCITWKRLREVGSALMLMDFVARGSAQSNQKRKYCLIGS